VYRRRRAVALLALVAVLLVTATTLRLALAGPGGGALTTSGSSGAAAAVAGPAGPAAPAGGHVYLVQPGDTLWSIVQTLGHGGDPRPTVDRLALQLDGRPLQPGQRLQLP
jgi:Tfp pilus assembly protein FimV